MSIFLDSNSLITFSSTIHHLQNAFKSAMQNGYFDSLFHFFQKKIEKKAPEPRGISPEKIEVIAPKVGEITPTKEEIDVELALFASKCDVRKDIEGLMFSTNPQVLYHNFMTLSEKIAELIKEGKQMKCSSPVALDLVLKDLRQQREIADELMRDCLKTLSSHATASTSAPLGLINLSNNCWANALLQLVINSPSLCKAALPMNHPLSSLIQAYLKGQSIGQTIAAGVNTQILRGWIPGFSKHADTQEDVCDALFYMLDQLKQSLKFQQTINGNFSQFISEPMMQITLNAHENTLSKLIEGSLHYQDDQSKSLDLHFLTAPQELFIRAKRFVNFPIHGKWQQFKVKDPLQVSELYQLDPQNVVDGQGALYELKSCILHIGNTIFDGHYMAVVKKEGHWFLCDDASTSRLNNAQAQKLLAQGYIFHYEKVI